MQMQDQRGFSLLELLIAMTILVMAMAGLASLLIQNSRINKSQQLTADVQANARNCLSLIVQKMRSAGWDPKAADIDTVITDQDLSDTVSEIEIFADLDEDTFTTSQDEQILIRHTGGQIQWRRTASGSFTILAVNISNDADGDGTIEPMFQPDTTPDPSIVTVQITAQSPVADPRTGDFVRYTVSSDVVFRKAL